MGYGMERDYNTYSDLGSVVPNKNVKRARQANILSRGITMLIFTERVDESLTSTLGVHAELLR